MKNTSKGIKPFTWRNLVQDFTLPITVASLMQVKEFTATKVVATLSVDGTIRANRHAMRQFVNNLRKGIVQ